MTNLITTPAVLEEIQAIAEYLTAAQDIITSGHMPDITPLEKRMTGLCEAMQNAPAPVQELCIEEFSSLLGKLDSTALLIKEWHERKSA